MVHLVQTLYREAFMKKSILLWILAVAITLFSAAYQRLTGPTHPEKGRFVLDGRSVAYKLPRAHVIGKDHSVSLPAGSGTARMILYFRRLNSNDEWSSLPLQITEGRFRTELPEQPTGGKIQYYLEVNQGASSERIPPAGVIVTRFRNSVPAGALIPHILAMFFGMLLSTRAGLEALKKGTSLKAWTFWAMGIIFVGGMMFGPLVQKYAFGAWWTGIPYGTDLTDNKTLIALVAWIVAALRVRKNPQARAWVIGAAIVTLIAFAIPHSIMGTEVDHLKMTEANQ
jgi:hypothetical protein